MNPKPCDAPRFGGFTGRFIGSYCSGMMFPDKHNMLQVCSTVFTVVS